MRRSTKIQYRPLPARSAAERTYPEYDAVLSRARAGGGYANPERLHLYREIAARRGQLWVESVLGFPLDEGDDRLSVLESEMLYVADEMDLNPEPPAAVAAKHREAAARAEQHRQRQAEKDAAITARITAMETEWLALVAGLPVPVVVAYNYSGPNHLETWTQGAVHILVTEALHVGRLRRDRLDALCTTPSSSKHQLFDGGHSQPDERRPTCATCIKTACRITGLTADVLLTGKK